MNINALSYNDGVLTLLDQTKLPHATVYRDYTDYETIARAIEEMIVRGAPAIGMTAAYGAVIGARQFTGDAHFTDYMENVIDRLWHTRPTAVNLMWALNRLKPLVRDNPAETIQRLEQAAHDIFKEDAEINRRIGEHLLEVLHDGVTLLTHCNPGALATAAYGTATAPMYLAHERGWNIKVYSDETRPRLQGALTAYELSQAGIDVTTITDSTAATLMQQGKIDAVIVGCDRIAANGDTVNKIGTMPLAICANYYNVPFYVAAPTPSFDISLADGSRIPIEERQSVEVTTLNEQALSIPDVPVYNPAFDITPHKLITGIATEHGIIKANKEAIIQLFEKKEITT
ncbi:S-methyl-5-thioribose-1-phosphate isomerase [Macrococcus equipercicus]|uniref:Methylthioribose-1-phosphate isomerase n=1 Tax=Macrococcus equipercicus TaxID=69967 RepID=A0ABQ6R6Y7_9STAP|nr:S-methyl-5-thioribose-1-phosphate isomerase [Macrococcus equipercicus]KAA1037627.1 S-methyl-5-thioribose-1-phosphate isomerase [Macrococcus equipercicus]